MRKKQEIEQFCAPQEVIRNYIDCGITYIRI